MDWWYITRMKKLENLCMTFIKPYRIGCREAEIVFWINEYE
jgi:hypothetical protein